MILYILAKRSSIMFLPTFLISLWRVVRQLIGLWNKVIKSEFFQGQVITFNCNIKIKIQDETFGQFRECLCAPHPWIPFPLEGLHLGWSSFRENIWIDVVRQKGQSNSLKLMSDINSFDLNKQTRQVSSVLMVTA